MNKPKFSVYTLAVIGLMAAMVFVATYFLRIEIPTPAGPTNLKVGNILCLLAGLLFGGLYGGLAAGIGSMFFDLLNPVYAASAPFTLVFFFMMAFVCGLISHSGGKRGLSMKWNIVGGICGALSYIVLHIGKSIITLVLAGSGFLPAVIACSTKLITSSINAVIAVAVSVLIAPVLHKALARIGVYEKLGIH